MPRRFLPHRAQAAKERAQQEVEASVAAIITLVELLTALADRMESMPSVGLQRDLERRARVLVLRRTAEAGRRTLAQRARVGPVGHDRQHQSPG